MLTWTRPTLGNASPSARTPGKPPPLSRTTTAIARAISTSSVSRLTLNAIRGRRAPTMTPPAPSSSRGGPKSGRTSPASMRRCSSAGPPCRKTGSSSSDPIRSARRSAQPRARSAAAGSSATIGTTSAAPMRGCAPSCRRRSIRSCAVAIPDRSAATRSSSSPTSVNTERLWSGSEWTSSNSVWCESAARRASIVARSRPSEKFGTDSSGNSIARTLGAGEGLLRPPGPRVRRLVARRGPVQRTGSSGLSPRRGRAPPFSLRGAPRRAGARRRRIDAHLRHRGNALGTACPEGRLALDRLQARLHGLRACGRARWRRGPARGPLLRRRPRVTRRRSSYRSLASLQRDLAVCRACIEAGYPLESWPVRNESGGQRAYMYGQAPGVVEGEERRPWRGRAGKTLRRWLELEEDEFYSTFYCASVTRCYPGRAPSGRGDRTPTPREQELCAFWREWELEILRPRLIVPVGGLAIRRLLGISRLVDCVGRRYELDGTAVVPLPHPSGASSWLNSPSNRELTARGAELVRRELAQLEP